MATPEVPEIPEKWFYVFKSGSKIEVIETLGSMPPDSPDLEDLRCIAAKAVDKLAAIEKALKFDASQDDKILS